MKIHLTENSFKNLISTCVYKALNETFLMEYLVHRHNFTELVWNLSPQIVENWCLVHYCTLVGRIETKEHWKKELYSYLKRISTNGIKANNSPKSSSKAIVEGFEMADLYNGTETIIMLITDKFEEENIPIDNNIRQVAQDFVDNINNLVEHLSYYNNLENIKKYINNI